MELVTNIAFWLSLLITVIGIAEIFYKLVVKRTENIKDIWRRIPFYGTAILILTGIILYDIYEKGKLYAGKVYSDQYLSVKIPSMFKGPLYNPDRYDLHIEISNNQDKFLLLSEIRAYFYNPKVAKKVKVLQVSENDGFFTSIIENPGVLPPKGNKSFPLIRGPVFIPREVEVVIFHSGSDKETRCRFIVSDDKHVESFSPTQVKFSSSELGIDGLDAIKKAVGLVSRWSDNAKLVSCLPRNSTTYIQESGLYVHKITEWIFTFKNNMEQGVVIVVNEKGAQQIEDIFDASDYPEFNRLIDLRQVNVGTIKALTLVNDLNHIYGNSPYGWALLPGRDRNDRTIPIWRLPYIGKDYLSIFVDAEKEPILPSEEYYRDYCPIERGSRITIKESKESVEEEVVEEEPVKEEVVEEESIKKESVEEISDNHAMQSKQRESVKSITNIKVEYKYNSLGICVAATAVADGLTIGEANMTHLEKGEYIEVKEIHYSPDGSGEIIYEAISKFSIPLGMKMGEEKIFGRKLLELFSSWPI